MKRKALFYTGSIIGVSLFTLLGLLLNVETVALHARTQEIHKKYRQLKVLNQQLEYQLYYDNSLQKIEAKATEILGMEYPKKVSYITPKKGE